MSECVYEFKEELIKIFRTSFKEENNYHFIMIYSLTHKPIYLFANLYININE